MTAGKSSAQTAMSPKLKYTLRVIVYFVLLAVINVGAFEGTRLVASWIVPSSESSLLVFLLGGILYLLGTVVLTWGFCRLDQGSLVDLGLQGRGWAARLFSGWGVSTLLVLLVFVALLVAGWLTVERASPTLLAFTASVLTWIIISFVEELTFRGYIMQGLAKGWGMTVAVVVSSILFAAVHSLNPDADLLGLFNIFFAGVFFAVGYLVTTSLWFAAGLHIGWNLTLIHIVGFPGSGFTEPSLFRSTVDGPDLMTGGAFGPEGGLVGLGAWLLGIGLLLGYRTLKQREERKREG
jgi:membrane protease YdiL (CAAX protease family)